VTIPLKSDIVPTLLQMILRIQALFETAIDLELALERLLAKEKVAGSNPVFRSRITLKPGKLGFPHTPAFFELECLFSPHSERKTTLF
jgi:hypothetical protein